MKPLSIMSRSIQKTCQNSRVKVTAERIHRQLTLQIGKLKPKDRDNELSQTCQEWGAEHKS